MPDLGRKIFRLTGPGKGATATATIDTTVGSAPLYQQVIGITITAGGSGYLQPPPQAAALRSSSAAAAARALQRQPRSVPRVW